MAKVDPTKIFPGKRFGRLTAIRRLGWDSTRKATYWFCICDCGHTKEIAQQSLVSKATKSCGCLGKEMTRQRSTKHGMAARGPRSSEYHTWQNIKKRTSDPNNPKYRIYGARGIRICVRWRNSFENFFADMGPKPGKGYSIERKDNNGPYSPENCIWATAKVQSFNKRSNRWITFQGKTLTLTQWADMIGLSHSCLHRRLQRFSLEEALLRPKQSPHDPRKRIRKN